ncbi:uncharacterized protein CDV56_104166 [Aspergillus thermomutatus]|uniref:Xylanolytic transcriptional activator regulatory domain-containing protein n=1 Tax=Aspergillus thermomutatus TaxID=41047 RepID=A0A397HCG3_ASPTH|nr:uncharacterized protein CDV56_104166 [Aspergillus thermomutatus]RHZ60795.1 hypothetical protein CDV56_104166 [Aspergillus thermomutatus]
MSLAFTNQPPESRVPYAIPQLEGERITIPGSKGTFRILASSKQTNGLMAVFQSGAVLSDAPGFHYHNHAHDVFLVTKGYLKLWNGDKCRIMGPGDFAYVPPKVIHNPEMLGPHTEIYGLITPGDWVDFFRYVSEPYEGILVPEDDNRDLKSILIPKVMAAKEKFDVVFQPNYQPPEVGEFTKDDEKIPDGQEPYYLRSNTGPRWMLGGVMSRPFITTKQSNGVCAISSIESSKEYSEGLFSKYMTFKSVDHCFCVLEGTLTVRLKNSADAVFREGETVVVPAGQAFALRFDSKYVRVYSFTDGDGIESLVHRLGKPFEGFILPDKEPEWDDSQVEAVATELNVEIELYIIDLEKKVEELTAKLRVAESELASNHSPQPQKVVTGSEPRPAPRASIDATPSSLPPNGTTPRDAPPLPYGPQEESGDTIEHEISELNHHTNGIEFHGSTSSAALIGHLQRAREKNRVEERWDSRAHEAGFSLISTLHNSSFSPSCTAGSAQPTTFQDHNYYFEHAHAFINGYFENIHFIHPLIDKEDFNARAHDLWFNRAHQPEPSFVALYLSVLSFGALVRVWDEGKLGGLTRFEWSRKLFSEAQMYLNHLHFSNNLDTVQCLYLMAKICQNELNPNLAYMYLGLAVRTCLAVGFNREVRNPKDQQRSGWISKTWWGIFSLEIEMSFSVGRPDTLGMDEYHNRALPERDDSEYAIIPWMVDFAQIIRRVSVQIYHSRITLQEKLQVALHIETELDKWMARLPDRIKPDIQGHQPSSGALRDPKWARRQRLVLGIRYYNVKMLLFRPFLSYFTRKLRHTPTELEETITKCLDAAMKTIEVIYDIFRIHTFFRCWWYNTTYVMFATSTLLLPMSKLGLCDETIPLLRSVEMAVEILEAMDESVVAKKSVEIIKHYLKDFRSSEPQPAPTSYDGDDASIQANAVHQLPQQQQQPGFDIPEWAYGFGFPDYSFEGIARLFDDLDGLPMLDG